LGGQEEPDGDEGLVTGNNTLVDCVLERGTHVYREATGVLLQHSSFNTLVGPNSDRPLHPAVNLSGSRLA
jgi:hypothetical protein